MSNDLKPLVQRHFYLRIPAERCSSHAHLLAGEIGPFRSFRHSAGRPRAVTHILSWPPRAVTHISTCRGPFLP
jgi:hypothetical protein